MTASGLLGGATRWVATTRVVREDAPDEKSRLDL
jgi:hypothetical protein